MISRPRNRAVLRSYTVSGVLLMMLAALIVSRALTSFAPATHAHVSFTHAADNGDESDGGAAWHAHGIGEDTEGDQLSDGLPEWLPSPAWQSSPRLARLIADGERVPVSRDIEPLPMPPRA